MDNRPGGSSNAHLRLRKEDDAGELEPLVLLRSSTTYELSLQGLQVLAEWRLDVSGKPLRELEIELDAGLTLLSATSGDMPLTWSEIANDDRNGASICGWSFRAASGKPANRPFECCQCIDHRCWLDDAKN